jgi:short-subunit dehydrogenase
MNIIITGASRGIGRELVKSFLNKSGNMVLAISRNRAALEALKLECEGYSIKSELIPISFDLEKDDFTSELNKIIPSGIGSIDILINNAGLLINKSFAKISGQDFDRIFNANVKAPIRLIQFLLPFFKPGSHIVNIGSMGGFQGSAKFPGLSVYSASKGALAVLTECLAEELKEQNIKVNCLALGSVQTEMLAEAFPGYQAPVHPDEMAKFIMEFALKGHHFMNGKILPISLSTP